MKNRSKSYLCLISFLIVLLSCCIVGVGIAIAASSDKDFVGEKYAPTIIIDYGEFDENSVPDAVINKSYKLLTATAEDLYGEEIYTHVRVWLFYDSETRSLVNVDDGCVVPTTYGVYTVEFTAVDRWQNKTTVLYDFECAEKEALKGIVQNDSAQYKAGNIVKVNDIIIENAIGDCNVSAKAILKSNPLVSYDISKDEFRPMYAGTYDIVFSIADYNETAECSYSVDVIAHDDVIWESELSLGKYYLAGCDNVLPEVKALSFSEGTPNNVAVTIEVTDPNGATSTLDSNRVFNAAVAGEYVVEYKAGQVSQSAIVNCIDVGYGDASAMRIEDYFVGKDFTKTSDSQTLYLSTTVDGAEVSFINAINSRTVYLELSVVSEFADNFSDFDVVLTDAENSTNSISFNFAKNGFDGGLLTASGGRYTKTGESFYANDTLAFEYDNVNRTVQIGTNQAISVVSTVDGQDFAGFESDFVFLKIRLNGVTAEAKIRAQRLANHVFFEDCGDYVAPDVIYTKFQGGDVQIGDIITLQRVFVSDVACPSVEVSYYVKNPSGKFVTDVNGFELNQNSTDYTKEYQFEIKEYGKYTVTIRATDDIGNAITYTYSINSVNLQAVSVQISYDQPTTAKLGETVTVCSYSVPGYSATDLTVRIFVIAPDRVVSQVVDNKFVANLRGEYEVWYYVTDASGNLDMVKYVVTVS